VYAAALGKALFGLWVATPDGGSVSWWRGTLRAATVWSVCFWQFVAGGARSVPLVLATITVLVGPGFVRADRRGLHDLLLATVVVHRDPHRSQTRSAEVT
jgi:uncharacterized RDD family membrane protein YckC